ncbi:MAG: hypothetical protein JO004_10210 [Methylobacteriaceae bacterium]|nr:hypothetical protein [Methylobacteriaceae bacterium]
MGQSALKHRDTLGQISHRHGNVHVGTMRRMYGHSFAAGLPAETTLYEVLELSGPNSVSEMHLKMLEQDYADGLLERKLRKVTAKR